MSYRRPRPEPKAPAITMDEAQEIHDLARGSDERHDQVSCWCCCADCDFEYDAVIKS